MSRRRSKFAPKHNLSLDELMPDRRDLEGLQASGPVNPESLAIRSEEAQRLREAVQKLPPEYRIVLVLRDMEGLTDEEVAEITGLRRGTVRVRLHRARLFVRKEFTRAVKPGRKATPRLAAPPRQSPRCKEMFAELSDYLDGELDDSPCAEIESHLGDCKPCQAFLASLEATIRQLRNAPRQPLDRERAAQLRNELVSLRDRLAAQR
jgi:RNA polymerase sigma-70 factor (ECF subfamily)